MRKICECENCELVKRYTYHNSKGRTHFICEKDEEKINQYWLNHGLSSYPGYIGYAKTYGKLNRKTAPNWCPKEMEVKA